MNRFCLCACFLVLAAVGTLCGCGQYVDYVPLVAIDGGTQWRYEPRPEALTDEHIEAMIGVLKQYNWRYRMLGGRLQIPKELAADHDLLSNLTAKATAAKAARDLTQEATPVELAALEAEIAKDPGVHALNRGAPPAMIDAAEARLGVKFPDTYRRFLLKWNGGAMFGPEFHSLNLFYVSDGLVEESGMEISRVNADRVAKGKRKIAIAADNGGYETFLDLDTGEVATFDRETREWQDSSDSIGDWLIDEIMTWREYRE